MKIRKVIEYTFTIDTDALAETAYKLYKETNSNSITKSIKQVIYYYTRKEDTLTQNAIYDNYDRIYKEVMQKAVKLKMNDVGE